MRNRRRQLWQLFRLAGRLAGRMEAVVAIRVALLRLKNQIAVWTDIRAFPALAVIAGLDCVAGLVFGRKYNGGPPLHLSNARLCVAAFAVAVLVIAGRSWLSRLEREPPAYWLRVLLTAACLLPMLALLSLANSQHSPWAVSFTSALAAASGGAVLLWNRRSQASSAAAPAPVLTELTLLSPTPIAPAGFDARIGALTGASPKANRQLPHSNSDEWMERTTGASGEVTLQGKVQSEFAAGQSIATVHIPFCPAFGQIPEFSCEVIDEPSVRTRSPAVFRYGARLEIKRTGDTSGPARLEIRFRATASSRNSSRAA